MTKKEYNALESEWQRLWKEKKKLSEKLHRVTNRMTEIEIIINTTDFSSGSED